VIRPRAQRALRRRSPRYRLRRSTGETQIEIVDDIADMTSLVAAPAESIRCASMPFAERGLGASWNECIERAQGSLVHLLHQDDLVKPSFYARMTALAARVPDVGMYFCRTEFLDHGRSRLDDLEQSDEGVVDRWLERITAGQRLQCPSAVVRRETYRRVGGFEPSLRYVIDWEMWVRIAVLAPGAYMPEPLAVYRIHASARPGRSVGGHRDRRHGPWASVHSHISRRCGTARLFPRAQQFAEYVDVGRAEAEGSNDRRAAIRRSSRRCATLSGAMAWRRWLQHVRWYLRLRFPALRNMARRGAHDDRFGPAAGLQWRAVPRQAIEHPGPKLR
jgi:hypothetical protein